MTLTVVDITYGNHSYYYITFFPYKEVKLQQLETPRGEIFLTMNRTILQSGKIEKRFINYPE